MPRRKSATSLTELCLQKVTANFGKVQRQLANQPSGLINNVYRRMCQRFQNARLNQDIFVHSGTKSLRQFFMFDLPIDPLLDRVGNVCGKLMELTLDGSVDAVEIPSESLIRLVRNLPQLRRLIFEGMDECTDHVVAEIGQSCRLLTHLSLSLCHNVTDTGLDSLLVGCIQLQELNISCLGVTADGILSILNQLPRLKVLKHVLWTELLPLLKQQAMRAYSVQEITHWLNGDDDFAVVAAIFPNLLQLCFADVVLHINFDCDRLQRLTRLSLDHVQLVDVTRIGRSCPVLEELTIVSCTILPGVDDAMRTRPTHVPFKNLRQLWIDGEARPGEWEFSEWQLLRVLEQFRSVERFYFVCCSAFSDDLVSQLVDLDVFGNLTLLSLHWCSSVSSNSIIKLLEMENRMEKLFCEDCDNIDVRAIDDFVQRTCLDVQVYEQVDV